MALQNPLLPVPQAHAETLPPAGDIQRIGRTPDHSVSENTRTMYNSAWRAFEQWTRARGVLAMPASAALVAGFLSHLAEERRLSVPTIRLHKAALAAAHKNHGHDDPTDHEEVRRVMKGIARTHGRAQKQAKPLNAEALATVRATANTRPWEAARSRYRLREPPGAAGWTWPCCPFSGTACSDAQRLIR